MTSKTLTWAALLLCLPCLGASPSTSQTEHPTDQLSGSPVNITVRSEHLEQIQVAISQAPAGSTINIPKGTFYGSLVVTKPMTIRGAGQKETAILSKGDETALIVHAGGGSVRIQGIKFGSERSIKRKKDISEDVKSIAESQVGAKGAGLVLYGPGEISFVDVSMRQTFTGKCIASAIEVSAAPLDIEFKQVEISGHRCYLAGVMAVGRDVHVKISDSKITNNHGKLAGAFLVEHGGQLDLQWTTFSANRFERGNKGHDVLLARNSSSGRKAELRIGSGVHLLSGTKYAAGK